VIILALIIGALLPIFTSVLPAKAAACSGSDLTITRQSSPVFYVDTGYQHRYVAYSITTSASKSYADLYVTWTNNGSSLAINSGGETFEDGTYHVGPLGTSSTATVYFYLKSTVVPPGNTPAGAQNYTLNLFNGTPVGNTVDCTSAQSNTSIETNGFANSNKVTSVTYTAPYLGSGFTMTVIGDTGQIGGGKLFSYSPAALGTWNADCMELRETSIVLSGGNTGTYGSRLVLTSAQLPNSPDTHYVITYTFNAKCVTSSSTPVAPLSYISSGGSGLNHTNTAGFSSLPPIAPATNSIVMTKSVNPASSTAGGTATYAVNITNNGPSSASIDSVVDILPSTPANAVYISGTSYFDDDISSGGSGVSISNPTGAGQTKTWTRTFTVPSGKTGQLTYDVTIPSTVGSYINSATGRSNTTVIDQTVDTTDNSPAVATYGVGNLSMAGSTKTASDINGGSLQPGDVIEYTIVAEAAGNEDASNVQITDTIDTNTENITNVVIGAVATNCGASYSNNSSSNILNITGVNITFGTSCIVTFQVSVKSSAASGTTILNSATIDPANSGGITGTPSSSPMVVRKDPILSVTNTENDADNVVIPNQVITYTATIRNTGQADANGIDLLATIMGPVGSLSSRTITNCGSAYVDTSAGLSINIAALAVTTSVNCIITYTFTVSSGATSGTVTNSVDITAAREGGNDPAAVNASNLLIGAAPTPPNLTVAVTENDVDNLVAPGQPVIYTTTITNSGQTDATTTLTSAIPTGMGSPSSVTYSNCGTPSSSYTNPTLSITAINIPAANICTITYTVVVSLPLDEGTTLTIAVDVAAASQGGNNPASVNATSLVVDATPVLGVIFSENDSDNVVTPSQDITYTLTVNNTGNGTATIVDAIDNLIGPAGDPSTFSFTSCGNVYTNNSLNFLDIVDLKIVVGTPCVVTYRNMVNSDASGGDTIDNSVDVSSAAEGGGDPIPVAASTLTVSAFPDLAVTSTENDDDNIVNPSQDITYTTTIANTGTSSASGVNIVDTFSGNIASIGSFTLTNCGVASSNESSGLIVSITNLQIASSGSCIITYHVIVSASAVGGSTIQNSADVSVAAEGGNNPAAVSATTQTVATIPNLSVAIADNDSDNIVSLGQNVGMSISIENTGNGNATGVDAFYSIDGPVAGINSIGTTNCGSDQAIDFDTLSLSVYGMKVTVGSICTIQFNVLVSESAQNDALITHSVDVGAALEGGNNPDAVSGSGLTVDASNSAPNTPIGVDSIELHDNNFVNSNDLKDATIYATITDPNEEDQVQYRIQIARNCDFSNPQIDYVSYLDEQGGFAYVYQENDGTYLAGDSSLSLADGSYCYRIKSIDEYNASSGWYQTDALKFKIDHTPPAKPVALFLIGETGDGTADIGWNETDESSPDPLLPYRLEYSLDPNFGEFTTIDTANLHKLINGLTPGARYYFRLYTKDSAGNLSVPSDVLDVLIPSNVPDPDQSTNTKPNTSIPSSKPVSIVKTSQKQTAQSVTAPTSEPVVRQSEEVAKNDKRAVQTTKVEILVVDQNGNKIKGAKVTIYSDPQTGYTDKGGLVVFYAVPVGDHKIIVEYAGKISTSAIKIANGTTELKIDVVMTNVVVKQWGWMCWLWLLLIIPVYYLIRRFYRQKRDRNNPIN
jgi:uncharacterized repeat protein (TIGR01451 family)